MLSQEVLRKEVKAAKAFHNISYKSMAEQIQIKQKSFYSWLKGDYSLSYQKQRDLEKYILRFKE